jgi:zinc D-Ala-D-Ala carboxypeptidase
MKLTQHFTLNELTHSSTAQRLKLDNTPTPEALASLLYTAEMLERIRATLEVPIVVTSGYRGPVVNRAVGGVSSSDHMTGQAADIVAPRFGTPHAVAARLAPLVGTLGIGQLILEGVGGKQWVHVSTRPPQKAVNRILTITNAGVRSGIHRLA